MACEGNTYDNAVYAEVSEKPGIKEFTMDKNSCYAAVMSIPSNTSSKSSEGKSEDLSTKKLLLMLFLVVLVLMLGTICACVAFALEISNLKSRAPLDIQQQDLSDAEMNTSLLQLQIDAQNLARLIQQLQTQLILY